MKLNAPDDLALFTAALAMPDAERDTFVTRACAEDAARARLIKELLRAHDSSAGFLETPAAAAPRSTARIVQSDLVLGDCVGPYRLVQKIGEGGCGTVYLANQTEPVRRQVALKVIKLGMDTQAVIARFDAERGALSRMDHPNIARVLDAGATASGRPFFVMELVRGIAITEYCDVHRLTTKERLRLFAPICRAVEHAHQKGVIHRDLKPSNILVTLQAGEPVPKAIDFGVAKATQGRLADRTLFTAVDQFVGTPAYMSPEQAESGEADVDTRTDIYSLGVLLYEMLAGSTPLGPEIRGAGVDQVRRMIREIDSPVSSARVRSLTAADTVRMAKCRSVSPTQWVAQLRGDLDWIVAKAIEKDRSRRYATVSALAADLQRHLHNEPVLARPPSASYRLQKLVARNKAMVIAGAAIALALASAATISTRQYLEERRARERAVLAEQAESRERRRAETALSSVEIARREAEAARVTAESHRLAAEAAQHAAESDRKNAEQARSQAERSQNTAEDARRRSDASHAIAVAAARELNMNLYAADMYAVQNLLRQNTGLPQVQRMLRAHAPASGEVDLRGIEWAYAWKLSQGDSLSAWPTEQGLVHDVSMSNDARLIVSAGRGLPGQQGQVRVWDAVTHRLRVALIGAEAAAFSPDSQRLITLMRDGRVQIWRTGTWTLETEFSVGRVDPIPNQRVELAIAPFGSLLAVCVDGAYGVRQGAVLVYDWQARTEVVRLSNAGYRFAFAGDGKTLATGCSSDGLIRIWDAETGALKRQLSVAGFVTSVAISSDGRRLAALVAGRSGVVRLWNLANGRLERTLPSGDLDPQPGAVVFSPDGDLVASAGADKIVRIWRTRDGRPVSEMTGSAAGIWALAFSPDGERLLSGGRSDQLSVWPATVSPKENETSITTLAPARADVNDGALQFSADGQWLAAADWERLIVCDARRAVIVAKRSGHHVPLWFSKDGSRLLVLDQSRRTVTRNDPVPPAPASQLVSGVGQPLETLALMRTSDGSIERTMPLAPAGLGVAVATSSWDGKYVALAWHGNPDVLVYDATTGTILRRMTPQTRVVRALAFSADGRQLAIVGASAFLEVWPVSGEEPPWRVAAHRSNITGVVMSADGTTLATCAADRTHKFWNLSERRELGQMGGFDRIAQAEFSSDGKTFWTATGAALNVWHVATLRDLGAFPLQGSPSHLALAPDRRSLAYCDEREGERRLILVRIPALTDIAPQFAVADAAQPALRIDVPGAKAAFAGETEEPPDGDANR